jgi:pimeloyl-ACP methyl ester carboxylesterase
MLRARVRTRTVTRTVAVLAAGALTASACTDGSSGVDAERADAVPDSATDDPEGAEPPSDDTQDAEQDPASDTGALEWSACEDAGNSAVSLECATLQVPLDHDDPGGAQIDIAVARTAATGRGADRIGSLVFNPGGPGGSGIELLEFLPLSMSSDILDRFDLVSFDPRGVGASTALSCDNDLDDRVPLLADGDDAAWQQLLDDAATQLDTCSSDSVELSAHVGTNNAARDMDLLRVALGDDGLTYVGYSYGTRLGATYAELFPENVRALVLDAAMKPVVDSAVNNAEQAGGFDRALENFAAACDADTDCILQELGPTLEVIDALEVEIADVGAFATDDPGRSLTPGELSLGIAAALYSKDSWPFLASALYTAETEQDGSLLQVLGDSLAGRKANGTYDNSQVANGFISCADDPARPDADAQRQIADSIADGSTHFAEFLRASTGCLGIGPAIDPIVIGPASGAAPIVVIGNSGDPATPYEWSVELADALDSAVLYTVEAEGHTAYGSIDCVGDEIDAYLIDLVVPAAGATCSDNADADFFVPEGESEIDQLLAFFACARDEGADIADLSEADILADPTLDTILGDIDLSDPSIALAFSACVALLPSI